MIIDTSKKVIKHNFYGFLVTLLVVIAIGTLLITKIYNEKFLGVSKNLLSVILALVYLLYLLFNYLHDYHYFYFSDEEENKLIFRFFPMKIMIERKSSIELNKSEFAGFFIERKLVGLREYLIIYQKLNNKIGKYPPISISILGKEEKTKLISTLNRYGQFKKLL